MTQTPEALTFRANLDPRSPTAQEVIVAVGRGDVNGASIGMVVEEDEWSSDMSHRTISRLRPLDCSVVSFPASPTTTAELLDCPEALLPGADFGGPDGTQNAPVPAAGSNGDGTGSRSRLKLEMEMLRLESERLEKRHGFKRPVAKK
jgi:hypothetical protein